MDSKITYDLQAIVDQLIIEQPSKLLKFLFYLRDKKKGLGYRDLFYQNYTRFCRVYPEGLKHLDKIPSYGSWKDLVALVERDSNLFLAPVTTLFASQMKKDLEDVQSTKKISTAAKWFPSSSKHILHSAIRKELNINSENLRKKYLTPLRKALQLCEIYMSRKEWTKLSTLTLPQLAIKSHSNCLVRHGVIKNDTLPNDLISLVNYSLSRPSVDISLPWTLLSSKFQHLEKHVIVFDSRSENKSLAIAIAILCGSKIYSHEVIPRLIDLSRKNISEKISILNSCKSDDFFDRSLLPEDILILSNNNVKFSCRSLLIKDNLANYYEKIISAICKKETPSLFLNFHESEYDELTLS